LAFGTREYAVEWTTPKEKIWIGMNEMIAIVIPAYNEEKTIRTVLTDIKNTGLDSEIIVVDDGSEDKTYELALEEGAFVLRHLINRGVGAAIITGIMAALQTDTEIIVTFDADLQHAPEDIETLIKPIINDEADVTIGSRFLLKESYKEMPFHKVIGNKILNFFTSLLARRKISDSQSGLRAFKRESLENMDIVCDRYAVSSELIVELSKRGLRTIEVPIKARYPEKKRGTTVISGIGIIFDLLLKKIKLKR